MVSKAASCLSLVTPAAHAESTKTGVSGRNALMRSAFETTQISVQRPHNSISSKFIRTESHKLDGLDRCLLISLKKVFR